MLLVVNVEDIFVLFEMIFSLLIFVLMLTGANQGWGESVVVNDRRNVTSECSVSTSDCVVVGRTATVRCRKEREKVNAREGVRGSVD